MRGRSPSRESGLRGVARLLGIAGAREERRRSPRIHCRIRCTLRRGRRWLPARVLDVSEGGLCLLSPVRLQPRQTVQLRIDVPHRGPVEVEAVAWHVRRVKSGRAHRKAWSIGMIIEKAGEGFEVLLPDSPPTPATGAPDDLSEKLAALGAAPAAQPEPAEAVLEEDALSAEELDAIDVDLLSPAELASLSTPDADTAADAAAPGTLRIYRVRVKARRGPRTRTLTVGALSATEAEALAASELDDAWEILEVAAT